MFFSANNWNLLIIGFLTFVIFQLKAADFDLAHPYVWFLPIFTMYSLASPVLVLIDEILPYRESYRYAILYHYIAAVTMVLVIGPERSIYRFKISPFRKNSPGIKFAFIVSLSVFLVYIVFLFKSGFENKYDRALSSNPFAFLGFGAYMLTTSISLVLLNRKLTINRFAGFRHHKRSWVLILIFSLIFVLATLVTGERHALFRMLLVIFVLYHVLEKPIPPKYLFFSFVIGLSAASALNQFKMFFFSVDSVPFSFERFVSDMLYGEFKSASKNLSLLINYVPSAFPYFYGEAFLSDIMRAVIPGFLFPKFQNTANWFNQTFHYHTFKQGLGLGFTLVGAGYVNFGLPGIIMLFAVIGGIIRKLYRKSADSVIIFLLYVNFIPIVSFSIRSDIASLISSTWKHVLLIIFIAWFVDNIDGKKGRGGLPVPIFSGIKEAGSI